MKDIDYNKVYLSTVICTILSFILVGLLVNRIDNLYLYIISIMLCYVTFILSYRLMPSFHIKKATIYIYAAIIIVLIYLGYIFENKFFFPPAEVFSRHRIPQWIFIMSVIITLITIQYMKITYVKNKYTVALRIMVGIFTVCLNAYMLYEGNLFEGDLRHSHAYQSSIFNVCYNIPYSEHFRSIYGHYGILYYLPVKLLQCIGINMQTSVMLSIVGVGAFAFLAIELILNKFIRNDLIFSIASFCTLYYNAEMFFEGYGRHYYQLFPHRIVVPMIVMAIYALLYKYDSRKTTCALVLTCSLACVWNIETGMICTVTVFVVSALNRLFQQGSKKTRIVLIYIVCIVSVFVISWGITNCYNVFCGGEKLNIKEYLYPYASNNYDLDMLKAPLPGLLGGNWLLIILVFIITTLIIFLKLIVKKKINLLDNILLINSIIAMGSIIYFINRPAYGNMCIVYLNFIIEIAIIFDCDIKGIIDERIEKTIKLIACIVISTYVAITAWTISTGIELRISTVWRSYNYSAFCAEIKMELPEEAACFGIGIPEICSRIGYDMNIYSTDWADPLDEEWVYTQALEYEYIFTSMELADIELFDDYCIVNQWTYPNSYMGKYKDFYLYKRN